MMNPCGKPFSACLSFVPLRERINHRHRPSSPRHHCHHLELFQGVGSFNEALFVASGENLAEI